MGFYGKKLTTYRDFVINKPKDEAFYGGAEHVISNHRSMKNLKNFGRDHVMRLLRNDQQAIYDMVDSLKANPSFMTYIDVVNFIFLGYKIEGPVEIGPVFTFLSYNAVEGLRPKFGLRTSNDFSTNLHDGRISGLWFRDERLSICWEVSIF